MEMFMEEIKNRELGNKRVFTLQERRRGDGLGAHF